MAGKGPPDDVPPFASDIVRRAKSRWSKPEREPGSDDEPPWPGEGTQQDAKDEPAGLVQVWSPLDPRWLRHAPPPRSWLLRRPTRDGKPCPPHEGDGLLPRGKVGLFVADGGVGKTMALLALAVSVITGRPWLGYFWVPFEARSGRVLLLLAEEDEEEVWRRLYDLSIALQLTDEEKAKVDDQLIVLPADGMDATLVRDDGFPSKQLLAFKERLDADPVGWNLIVIDTFSQVAGIEAETDNAIATRTLRSIRKLCGVAGSPTVIIAHHAPGVSLTNDKPRARGVTAIRNAARWEATLRQDERFQVWFRQSKSNYSTPMREELRLVRDTRGLLRAENSDEEHDRTERQAGAKDAAEAARDARRENRIGRIESTLLDLLAQLPVLPTSLKEITALAKGGQHERVDAVARLIATKRLLKPEQKGEPYRLASLVGTQVELGIQEP